MQIHAEIETVTQLLSWISVKPTDMLEIVRIIRLKCSIYELYLILNFKHFISSLFTLR